MEHNAIQKNTGQKPVNLRFQISGLKSQVVVPDLGFRVTLVLQFETLDLRSKTVYSMIIDHTYCLHVGIYDC